MSDDLEQRIERIEQELGIDEERHRDKAREIAGRNDWEFVQLDSDGIGTVALFHARMLNITDIERLSEYPSVRVYDVGERNGNSRMLIGVEL
jgi:hypothetical protein